MKNPKLQFEKEQLKWFVIDAPEMPHSYLLTKLDEYQETFSKAPRWEVKNQEEVNAATSPGYTFDSSIVKTWQPDPTKLYDVPKGWQVEFKPVVPLEIIDINPLTDYREYIAILIPEEEVKETESLESRYLLKIIDILNVATPLQHFAALEVIKALCKEYSKTKASQL